MKRILISGISLLLSLQLCASGLKQSDAFLNQGLSIKAISMGNSYIGITDDVATAVYNPASLSMLRYKQFYGAYAQDTGFNANKLLLGYADLIDHQFNFCVILMRSGSGGIEEYTDSGEATGNMMDNSCMVGQLSTSLPLWSRLSGGASLKILNQSLADYGSTGAGFDLGLYWRRKKVIKNSFWETLLYNFEFGLAGKNLLGPNLKFRAEEEREPFEIRGGAGYTIDLISRYLKNSYLLLTAEAVYNEWSEEVAPVFGAEFMLFGRVGLRGGYGSEILRTGLGVQYRKFEFNYGYMRNSYLGETHNIGMTICLKNLQGPKADQLYEQGLKELQEKKYNTAVVHMEDALDLAPERGDIAEKIKEVRTRLEEEKKSEEKELNLKIQNLIKSLPVDEKEVIEVLYYEGLDKYNISDRKKAVSFWEKIDTKNVRLKGLLKSLIEKVKGND